MTSLELSNNALRIAERFGVLDYKVKGNFMIYNVSYPAYLSNPRYTVQHKFDLRTCKEVETKTLKRFDPQGYNNR